LSGGMRQRVSLARALAIDPQLIFLDESFSQLDHVTSRVLRSDFLQIAREFNKTCLLITHRIDDALEMADRALVLSPPAKIALELKISEEARADPKQIAALHAQIAAAMGEQPNTEH
jgi:NitT/TauT family transport system ATP-binding protein